MSMIIECIDRDGIHSVNGDHFRFSHPHVGDLIQPDDTGKLWIIDRVEEDGSLSVCEEWYQDGGFISWNKDERRAHLSISGGPFRHLLTLDLEPTLALQRVSFWNWGDNCAGAGKACTFWIHRPVFRLINPKAHGYDIRKLCEQWNNEFLQCPSVEPLNIKSLKWTEKDIKDVCEAIGTREKYAKLH